VAELLRPTLPRRSLSGEQRAELLRLIADVPHDATRDHPAVRALIDYHGDLRRSGVPWWTGGTTYLQVGGTCSNGRTAIEEGLDVMRRLADVRDWGEDPTLSPDCSCSGCRRRRARV
jgi:hypothetical protein